MEIRTLQTLWVLGQVWRAPSRTYLRDLILLRRRPRNVTGTSRMGKWQLSYADCRSASSMWIVQFLLRKNDLLATTRTPRILDCGANIGVSVLRYKDLYPDARLTAFEPDPALFKILRQNIEQNHLDNVELVQAAVWTENGDKPFASFEKVNTLSGHLVEVGSRRSGSTVVQTPTVDLCGYLQKEVDFLKMDIEGAEFAVVEHCACLLYNVAQILVEVHHYVERSGQLVQLLATLKDAGFEIALYQPSHTPTFNAPFKPNPTGGSDQYILVWGFRR
jgi:FkbM family methyltransferase